VVPAGPMPGPGDGQADGTADTAQQLLATPVITDQDVLDRVSALIGPVAGHDPARALWLLFLDAQGIQQDLVIPVGDVPEEPGTQLIGDVCYVVSQAIARWCPGCAAVITLSRPGPAALASSDRHYLGALQLGTRVHGTPVRMLCLATPQGVRELGPALAAAPSADAQPGLPEPGI
jgi:hypothetical protein